MLKQNLQQKLLQKLSPQQIQMIKLLALPTLQFEQRIKKELEENPALDDAFDNDDEFDTNENQEPEDQNKNDDEFSFEDYLDDDEIPNYKLNANNYSKDDEHKDIPYSSSKSFHEYLNDQLVLKKITEREKTISKFLIGNIDEDGYMRRELEAIVDDVAFSQNMEIEIKELENVLSVIKELDPAGVGAQNLQECLLLQLDRKEVISEDVALARKIIDEHFDEFIKKHYKKIMSKCNIDEAQLKKAIEVVLKLNPKPGSSFGEPQTRSVQSIIPDFIIEIVDGKVQVNLNSRNTPELKISRNFVEMMEKYANSKEVSRSDKDALVFIKQKLDSAKWFIDAVVQRQNTLLFSMNAIVNFQEKFFLTGDETDLKPMILKDVAQVTGLDISTISRVANSKYVSTPYGNYQLKYFFSESMQTSSGEEVSTREIKQILKDCIEEEDKSKPLTDDKLAEVLNAKGYKIARRTIAKYREQLDIPVARLRKEL